MNLIEKYNGCVDPAINKTRQTRVVLKENNRRYSLWNEKNGWEVTKVKIEKCITTNEGQKGCEAILLAEKPDNTAKGFFIELKGCSVGDALKQIEHSLNIIATDLKNINLFGRIIPTEYKKNKFLESHQQRLILRFKQLGGNFIIKENYEDKI